MKLTLRPYQEDALARVAAAEARGVRSQLGVAATGLGKFQPLDEPVLTPAGWATMGDLRPGDEVVGSDGKPTTVLSVHPQGVQPVVRVTFRDGTWTRCGPEHLWNTRTKSEQHRGMRWRTVTAEELRPGDHVPLPDPAHHADVPLPVDPYTLGVLLGDGSLGCPHLSVCTDRWIADHCGWANLRPHRTCAYVCEGAISDRLLRASLVSLGLWGKRAWEKHVPPIYMLGSPDQRVALLRGLMDTDGSPMSDGGAEFSSTAEPLVQAVAALVRSLGGVARNVTRRVTHYTYQNERRRGRPSWRVNIKMPADWCPFALPRKAERWVPPTKYPPAKIIASVEPDGPPVEQACIKVASADGLYLTRDYVVTHNTVIFCALAERRGKRTLVLAHRDELVSQAEAKVREVWPDAAVGVVKAERNEVRADVVVASVQTLARPRRLAQLMAPWSGSSLLGVADPFDLVVVDEAHHTAAASYRGILDHLRAGHGPLECDCDGGCPTCGGSGWAQPNGPLLLGVTATPDRGDGKGLDDLFSEVVFSYDLLWGIRADYLADLRGRRVSVANLDLGAVRQRHGDYDQGQAGRAMEAAGVQHSVVAAWQAEAADRRTLVFTPTVEVARLVADEFRHHGVAAAYVHGGTPLDERRAMLADYQAGRLQVLANCAVLTEGFDAPRTDCIVIARPTKSRALYCFDAATEVLTPSGWERGNTVVEGDTIAAFDPTDGAVRWEPVLATVERPLLPTERMMALRSPSIDIRVTDTHRMVWRRRSGRARTRTAWEVSTAGELAARPDVWELPVGGAEKAPGVPLTDAELAFIGWVQTDGSVNKANGQVHITQQRPDQRAHIEATLDACGFKWRVTETIAATNLGPRRHPLGIYRVSKGAPRGTDQHLRGWGALAPWLPKADPSAWARLEDVDADQWAVLLDAWHRGDGSKQTGQSWTRRGYHLAIADEWTAGWVQGMCMRRGWRANVARQGTVWMVHARQGTARHVGGASSADRARLVGDDAEPDELVWCVSVPSGAILTRRNGKGAVVGQTQMVGRGTRRHPDKDHCLVLDLVGASAQHSLVTVPSLFGLEDGYAERMGDASAGLADVVQERDDELVRVGQMKAEDADLFRKVRTTGIAWVSVHVEGDPLRRYVRDLGRAQDGTELPTVVLAQRTEGDVWTAGLWWMPTKDTPGSKQVLLADAPLETAQGVAEDFVRVAGARHLTDADAKWRKGKPSVKALAAAKRWRLVKPEQYATAGELSDALGAHISRIKAKPPRPKVSA